MKTTEQRFQERLAPVNENGCIEWTGAENKDGYGVFWFDKKNSLAHRYALQKKIGRTLSAKEYACHTCDNPPCVNEDHLFVGTQLDNMRDARAKGNHHLANATHCKRNHEFTEANTRITNGRRICRTCHREMMKERRKAQRAA